MRPWYALYPGDFQRDTQNLSCEEVGAYIRLMNFYYSNRRPIPNDLHQIKRVLGESLQKTRKILKVLSVFFLEKNGFLTHKRIDIELSKSEQIHEVKSKAAHNRWGTGAYAPAIARPQPHIHNANEPRCVPGKKKKKPNFKPPIFGELNAYIIEKNLNVDPNRFIDFYESKGWLVGKAKMKDWKAAARNWSRSQKDGQNQRSNKKQTLVERVEQACRERDHPDDPPIVDITPHGQTLEQDD